MHTHPDAPFGPHWEAGLFSPCGKLTRLCKGSPQQPVAAAPPVRESARDVQIAGEQERLAAAGGSYAGSIKKTPLSLLSLAETGAPKRSLLGQ
ncbi:MAG: hypothetical protein JWO82_3763 [Akkermansiaceae bacterium]|nr:hypothetical protein [Akkermansiaceae bacterium]